MFSQNKLGRLIPSIYVKLHIKSRGLFSTPFKPGNGYYRRKQQQDNKPLNIYIQMILMNGYTVSNYKSSTIDTQLRIILATLILGTSRFRSSSIKVYFYKYNFSL